MKSAHTLYYRTKKSTMTFAEIAEVTLENGPKSLQRFSRFARLYVEIGMFVTYFGSCAAYIVIISLNSQQMIEYYAGLELDIRLCMMSIIIPCILLSYIPNLKYMAPFSLLANVFMASGLSITVYYFVSDLKPITEVSMSKNLSSLPTFFSITIFALEAVGVIMPLENNMKTPQNFIGSFGVLNKGMAFIITIYTLIGALGYWCYGEATNASITINLPTEEL